MSNNPTTKLQAYLGLCICQLLFISGCQLQSAVSEKPSSSNNATQLNEQPAEPPPPTGLELRDEAELTETVRNLVKRHAFRELDAYARNLSDNKVRFRGGSWKIFSFDLLVSNPPVENPSEAHWKSHLTFVNEWKNAMSQSIVAHTAAANANLNYAWVARGDGFIDSVTPENRKLYESRLSTAVTEIGIASDLEERYHGYFFALLKIANSAGLDRGRFDAIFDEAIRYDPTYQYFYTQKAAYLLPRWYGRPGDWEEFAEKVKSDLGAIKGFEMYYLIVVEMAGMHGPEFFKENRVSWEDTKTGFELFEKDYGMSRRKLNQFGSLARHADDGPMGCQIFNRLRGENDFDPYVWTNRKTFEFYRNLSLSLCGMGKLNTQAK